MNTDAEATKRWQARQALGVNTIRKALIGGYKGAVTAYVAEQFPARNRSDIVRANPTRAQRAVRRQRRAVKAARRRNR